MVTTKEKGSGFGVGPQLPLVLCEELAQDIPIDWFAGFGLSNSMFTG